MKLSLPKVFNQTYINQEMANTSDYSKQGLISYGAKAALIFSIFVATHGLISVWARMSSNPATCLPWDADYREDDSFLENVILMPVVEEILFRGILQNGIYYGQKFLNINPNSPKPRTFRILTTNTIFAATHLNEPVAVIRWTLDPMLSLIFECANRSLLASTAAHATNNALSLGVSVGVVALRNLLYCRL